MKKTKKQRQIESALVMKTVLDLHKMTEEEIKIEILKMLKEEK